MDKGAEVKKSLVKKASVTREFSAGGAVFRRKVLPHFAKVTRGKKVEWLVIRPAGTERWQLPKGRIEEGESGEDAAVREVFEETNARVKVLGKIDTAQYFYVWEGSKIFKNVVFFLMGSTDGHAQVNKAWAHEIDEVLWLVPQAALKKLTFVGERKILQKAEDMLKAGVQDSLA